MLVCWQDVARHAFVRSSLDVVTNLSKKARDSCNHARVESAVFARAERFADRSAAVLTSLTDSLRPVHLVLAKAETRKLANLNKAVAGEPQVPQNFIEGNLCIVLSVSKAYTCCFAPRWFPRMRPAARPAHRRTVGKP